MAFFVVAPVVFVIFHFYVFLQIYALAKKAEEYNTLLKQQVRVDADRHRVRQRLDTFLILQFLAGPKEQRTHFQGFALRLIAWITLVGAPILILLQAQVTFLPYHHEQVAWAQRVLLAIDLAVIWAFWDRVRGQDDPILGGVLTPVWKTVGLALTLCVALFSVLVATYPGEWADDHRRRVLSDVTGWNPLHDWLFAGEVNEVSGKPRSLFSNRLVLTDQSFVDSEKLDKVEVSRPFRGRDLRGAVLNRADLRKADFTGAMLDAAELKAANLQQARFGYASRAGNLPRRDIAEVAQVQDRNRAFGLKPTARRCKGHRSMERGCKGHRSMERCCKGRRSLARNCKGRRSLKRSCKGHRSIGRGCKGRRSIGRNCKGRGSLKRG